MLDLRASICPPICNSPDHPTGQVAPVPISQPGELRYCQDKNQLVGSSATRTRTSPVPNPGFSPRAEPFRKGSSSDSQLQCLRAGRRHTHHRRSGVCPLKLETTPPKRLLDTQSRHGREGNLGTTGRPGVLHLEGRSSRSGQGSLHGCGICISPAIPHLGTHVHTQQDQEVVTHNHSQTGHPHLPTCPSASLSPKQTSLVKLGYMAQKPRQ